MSYEEAYDSLERMFRKRGLPCRMRLENGSPFASTGTARLSRMNVWWWKLGIAVERIEPGKPQQNGRHERIYRTLKAETTRLTATAVEESTREYPKELLDPRGPIQVDVSPE